MDSRPDDWQPCKPTSNFMSHLGTAQMRMRDGRLEFAFDTSDVHRNANGIVHGGMLMTFADYALGFAARVDNDDKPSVTITLTLDFITAAQTGDRITCHPEIVRKTRSLYFLRGDLMVGSRVIATANGIWKKLKD